MRNIQETDREHIYMGYFGEPRLRTRLNVVILDFYRRLAILSPGEIVANTKKVVSCTVTSVIKLTVTFRRRH